MSSVSLFRASRLDFVLWGWAVWGRRRFHPSTRGRSNSNAEFIEVVKQSVDNMDGVFLINTAIPRETANCGEVSKTQQRFPRLRELRPRHHGINRCCARNLQSVWRRRLMETVGLYTNQSSSLSPSLSLSLPLSSLEIKSGFSFGLIRISTEKCCQLRRCSQNTASNSPPPFPNSQHM